MYLEFFGFKEEPFDLVYNPELLHLSPSHEAMLETLMDAVKHRKGIVMILGERGIGKTAVLTVLIERLTRASVRTILIPDAQLSFQNILLTLYQKLDLGVPAGDLAEALCHFEEALIKAHGPKAQVVLIVDDAQNLPMDTLQHLDWWYASRPSLGPLQVLLAGRPELEERLTQKELQSFKHSIGLSLTLAPLTDRESFDYIHHRLSRVGSKENIPFTWSALKRIVEYARGNPHQINILCNNALIAAYQLIKTQASLRIVKEVIRNLEGRRRRRPMRWVGATVLTGLLLLAAFQLWVIVYGKPTLAEFVRLPFLTIFEHKDAAKGHNPEPPSSTVTTRAPSPPTQEGAVPEESTSTDAIAGEPKATEPELDEKPGDEPEPIVPAMAAEETLKVVPEEALPEGVEVQEEAERPDEAVTTDTDPARVVDWLINMKRSQTTRP